MPIIRIYEHKKNISHSKMCNARAPLIDRLHTYCRLNADIAKNPPPCFVQKLRFLQPAAYPECELRRIVCWLLIVSAEI